MKKYIYLATATLITAGLVAGTHHSPAQHNDATSPTVTAQVDPVPASSTPAQPDASASPAPATTASTPSTSAPTSTTSAPASTAPVAPTDSAPTPAVVSTPAPAPVTPQPTVTGEREYYQDSTTQANTQDAFCIYSFTDGTSTDKYVGSRPTPAPHQPDLSVDCPAWRAQ